MHMFKALVAVHKHYSVHTAHMCMHMHMHMHMYM